MDYSYKVIREFTDKDSGKKYVVNEDHPTDISNKRIKTLLFKDNEYNQQYIAIVPSSDATKADLIEIAEKHNIEVSEKDTKADILKVLEG